MNNEEFDYTDSQMLRKKAEKALKEMKKKAGQKDLDADVKKLVHELQVHQIELEMQNEELLLAYESAEKALRKYTLLYDFAPMGYLTTSVDGTIHDVNISAAEMIGERRVRLLDTNMKVFLADESKPVFCEFLEKIIESGTKQSCVVSIGSGDKPSKRTYMEGVFVEEDNKCFLSFLDITDLKKK